MKVNDLIVFKLIGLLLETIRVHVLVLLTKLFPFVLTFVRVLLFHLAELFLVVRHSIHGSVNLVCDCDIFAIFIHRDEPFELGLPGLVQAVIHFYYFDFVIFEVVFNLIDEVYILSPCCNFLGIAFILRVVVSNPLLIRPNLASIEPIRDDAIFKSYLLLFDRIQ